MLILFSCVTSLLVGLSLLVIAEADAGPPPPLSNTLYGFVTSNTTLTYLSPGPVYYLVGDVIVNPGVTLTIEPGVTVVCNANGDTLQGGLYSNLVELTVRGSLVAVGTVTDSIRFVASDLGTARWGEIRVESGGAASLIYASVRGAALGLRVLGNIDASSCLFSKVANGVEFANGATGTFNTSRLEGRGTGVSGVGIRLLGDVAIAAPDSTTPVPLVVSRFSEGLRMETTGRTVSHVVAVLNGYGIRGFNGGHSVSYCTAVDNLTGFSVSGGVYSSIAAINVSCGIESGFANYVDAWSNGTNFCGATTGSAVATFNPFFIDYSNHDLRLAEGSIFKTFGPWGAEIGAYGPGPGQPVQATQTTWGRIKAERR